MKTKRTAAGFIISLLFMGLLFPGVPLASAPGHSQFPEATPESQGVSSAALDAVFASIEKFFESDEIVGAEFLVIINRKVIYHRSIGWKDREEKIPYGKNTIVNIRSMTKPLTGAGIHILAAQGKLNIDDPVSKYLKGFSSDQKITIEQLLTHRSGLPLSLLMTPADLEKYKSLVELADATGEAGAEFEPGSKFWYSDAGSEVLGAITEIVSGMPLAVFRAKHIFEPLGMTDTLTLSRQDDARKNEAAILYAGTIGNWKKAWSPENPSFYPFAMGSQSIYSTPMDYAKFLAMWLDGGQAEGREVLSQSAVKEMLTPVSKMKVLGSDSLMPTGFPHHDLDYGQMAMLYCDTNVDATKPVIVGHNGSDGTYAWAWPGRDLIVAYFTQSRGTSTGLKLEKEIYRRLINPDEPAEETPEEFKPFVGTYTGTAGSLMNKELTVLVQNGSLAVDVPGMMVFELTEPDDNGMRYFKITDNVGISFDRDEEGKTVALRTHEKTPIPRAPDPAEPSPEGVPDKFAPYVGKYLLGPTKREIFVRVQDGRLAIDFAEQGVPKLVEPEKGERWYFEGDKSTSVTFARNESGEIVSMDLLQVSVFPKGRCAACLVEEIIKESGVDSALKKYRDLKGNRSGEFVFFERSLNAVGYKLMTEGRVKEAIEIFKLNVEEYPKAFNAYDSLGEAYMKNGDKELAIQYFKKSLELNPKNENAKTKLKELAEGK